ncbi:MAG: class I mannose-6-phosphate isomerase [Planctomycetes bacterium]|jgi:mannose-6-phosphate isomerase|nr:class I mannose-6-phosphate isomerase [Planctomycetota bacterium]MCL4731161.1 class I mannose-6-phosphate isomerase [Planctomycetota bacterium]
MTYPLRLHRVALPKPWAGRELARLYPQAAADWPEGTGESLEAGDLPGASSVVANGPWRDLNLGQLMQSHRLSLLGQLAGADELPDFPLCLKLLDTREPLSVQNHPGDQFRRGHRVFRGKSEAWLVLHAQPGAVIYQGLRPGLKPADFEDALRHDRAAEALRAWPVQAGDWLYNPAGVVHAVGGGLALWELQQNCPLTYRLWDFPRPGGPRRELHRRQGMAAARWDLEPVAPRRPRDDDILVDEGPFGARMLRLSRARQLGRTWAGFTLMTCLAGRCEVTARAGNTLEAVILHAPETVLFPSDFTAFEFYPQGPCELMLAWARAS